MKTSFYQQIIDQIETGSKVLDLGCGKGQLLDHLIRKKKVLGYGIDIQFDNIISCVKRQIPVFQGNIDEALKEFKDNAFDTVILSQTIQEMVHPENTVKEMLRVGKTCILTFPNFAYWEIRTQLLKGYAPRTATLPYTWYNTPNIRVLTIKDFQKFCCSKKIHVTQQTFMYNTHLEKILGVLNPNLFATKALYIIKKKT